jgi:hypothetical protein
MAGIGGEQGCEYNTVVISDNAIKIGYLINILDVLKISNFK